ncbi:unnamed protein product, partial [Prorocentrum cordatum]
VPQSPPAKSRALKRGIQVADLGPKRVDAAAGDTERSSSSPCSVRLGRPAQPQRAVQKWKWKRGAGGALAPEQKPRSRSGTPTLTRSVECRFGNACRRPDCWYTHPDGRARVGDGEGFPRMGETGRVCNYGRMCKRPDCWFRHPGGRVLKLRKERSRSRRTQRYRSSSGSQRSRRGASGSRAAAGENVRPCWHGASCTRENCPFDHPAVTKAVSESTAPAVQPQCHRGYFCRRPHCNLHHPAGRAGARQQERQAVRDAAADGARRAPRPSSRAPRAPSKEKLEGKRGDDGASDGRCATSSSSGSGSGSSSSSSSSSSSEPRRRSKRARKSRKAGRSPTRVAGKANGASRKAKRVAKKDTRSRGQRGRGCSASSRAAASGAQPARRRRRRPAGRSAGRPASNRSASRAAEPARWSPAGSSSEARGASPSRRGSPAGMTFQAFVRDHVDGSATADEALAMWRDHSARRRFQLMKEGAPGLLNDLYHPHAVLRRLDLRLALARGRAAAFASGLRGGLYDGICLRASAPQAEAALTSGAPECHVAGHLEPPAFALDPGVGAVIFRGVPAAASAWSALEALRGLEGLVDFSWQWPSPGEASSPAARDVLARFETPALAAAALRAAAPVLRATSPGAGVPALLEPAARLRAIVCPAAPPEGRAGAGEALSAKVVRHLDMLMGIPSEVTQAVLGWAGSSEKKLDVQVTYLRRVHHFCFYSARWCEDAWDLYRNCGAVVLRGVAEEGEAVDSSLEEARERSIARFLGEARLERAEPCEPAEREVVLLCQERTEKLAEGRYRCSECRKLFRGPEFAEKHVRRAHAELFDELRKGAREKAMYLAFAAGERLL